MLRVHRLQGSGVAWAAAWVTAAAAIAARVTAAAAIAAVCGVSFHVGRLALCTGRISLGAGRIGGLCVNNIYVWHGKGGFGEGGGRGKASTVVRCSVSHA
jgi:hypothetical protein